MEQIWDTMGKNETEWEEWGLNLSHPAGAFLTTSSCGNPVGPVNPLSYATGVTTQPGNG